MMAHATVWDFWACRRFAMGCDLKGQKRAHVPTPTNLHPGYGPLEPDPKGVLNLPAGFNYKIISQKGNVMSDGLLVPGSADGMATFRGPDDKVIVIRNHEVSPGDRKGGPFGEDYRLLSKVDPAKLYDYGRGTLPCLGGTTTFIYNPGTKSIEVEYLSLAGTIRNCAGGLTPWNSWISCEENTSNANDKLEKRSWI